MAGTEQPVATWVVVLPVKRLALAKTRLSRFAGEARADLALAFALDVAGAVLRTPGVVGIVAVTDDAVAAEALTGLGVRVVADEPDAGLNPALLHGASTAAQGWPGAGVVALSSDLPALRPAELAAALDRAGRLAAAFVADAEGTGTTLLAARSLATFTPRFGHRSRAAHRADGVSELDGPGLASVRRDVDTEVDVHDAVRLGLGPRSAAVVARLVEPHTRQATVATFDTLTRSGSVVLDDGAYLEFAADAFDAGGLRLVRPGQRVRIDVDHAGVVLVAMYTT